MIKIGNIKLALSESEEMLPQKIARALHIPRTAIVSYSITKKAVDARDRKNVHFVYSVEVKLNTDEKSVIKRSGRGDITLKENLPAPAAAVPSLPSMRPVVVGAGPAGLFAALTLAKAGAKPILIERGEPVEKRAVTVNHFWKTGELSLSSNVQFGEGGAGAFSDGKLNSGTHDKRRAEVFKTFVEHGAPPEISYIRNPHIGSDNLPKIVSGIRNHIISLGGEVYFNHTLREILTRSGRVSGVLCRTPDGEVGFDTDNIVLAVGHSARDVFSMLLDLGITLEKKPFSIGVRIEHLQRDIDKNQYGAFARTAALGAADYKLSSKLLNGRTAYTFCMCPGGTVINASSEEGGLVTNGMSLFARDGRNANSALLVSVSPDDFPGASPLSGVDYQRKIERAAFALGGSNFRAPAQTAEGFLSNKLTGFGRITPTFLPGVTECCISELFPEYITESLRAGIRGFARLLPAFGDGEAVLTAPETRSSSPVRIVRGDTLESSLPGLFPCGEGAGYSGGILSSAVDGIRVAEAVLKL